MDLTKNTILEIYDIGCGAAMIRDTETNSTCRNEIERRLTPQPVGDIVKGINLCADFIADIEKHIDLKDDLQKGDREAWGKWFDTLMMWSNMSERMATSLREEGTAVATLQADNVKAREIVREFVEDGNDFIDTPYCDKPVCRHCEDTVLEDDNKECNCTSPNCPAVKARAWLEGGKSYE